MLTWFADDVRRVTAYEVAGELTMLSFWIDGSVLKHGYSDDDMRFYGSSTPGWSEDVILETIDRIGWTERLGPLADCDSGKVMGGRVHRTLVFERGIASVSENNVEFTQGRDGCSAPLYRRYTVTLVEPRDGVVEERIEPLQEDHSESAGDEADLDAAERRFFRGPRAYPRVRLGDVLIAVDDDEFPWIGLGDSVSYGIDGCGRIWWPWPLGPQL
ncbi:hypothetical protein ABI59_14085 [Acidobacteria bacterium Mor1]|nr:hypothetical protein ABI59_14085 [Acidobacteria bacterium Mor1]